MQQKRNGGGSGGQRKARVDEIATEDRRTEPGEIATDGTVASQGTDGRRNSDGRNGSGVAEQRLGDGTEWLSVSVR